MNKKNLTIVAGILALVGATAFAQPQGRRSMRAGPDGPRGARGSMDMARVQKALGLDEAQVEQLRQIQSDQRKTSVRNRADIEVARMELEELLQAEGVDVKAVKAKVDELAGLQARALRTRIDSQLAVREILSAEQARKLDSFRFHRRQRDHQRRPMRRGRGGQQPGGTAPVPPEEPSEG